MRWKRPPVARNADAVIPTCYSNPDGGAGPLRRGAAAYGTRLRLRRRRVGRLFDGNFVAKYPKSSDVYFAIIDAIDQGVLQKSEFEAIVPGPAGYWRAAARLKSIQQRLSSVAEVESRPERAIAVVFIESDLWARFEPGPQGFELILHTPGARDGDVVVVTSEGSIAALMEGRLSADVAFNRRLIAVDGEAPAREAIQKLLMAAFDPAPNSRPAAHGGRPAPTRFFGPRP
jgi:hypothetical protein